MTVNEALAIVGLKERDNDLLIDSLEEKIFSLTRPLLSNKPLVKIVRSRLNKVHQLALAAHVLDPDNFQLIDQQTASGADFSENDTWTNFLRDWNSQLLKLRRDLANSYQPSEVVLHLHHLLSLAEVWEMFWSDYFPEPSVNTEIPALSSGLPIDILNLVKAFTYLEQNGVSTVIQATKKSMSQSIVSDLDQSILLPLFQEKIRSRSIIRNE